MNFALVCNPFACYSVFAVNDPPETSSSIQSSNFVLALGIDSLGTQSLKALVTQLGVTKSEGP